MKKLLRRLGEGLLAAAILTCADSAFAINGMYLTGYGTESLLMGGADVAVARDAFAATNNPAGMTQLNGQAADVELAVEHDLSLYHSDSFGNNEKLRSDHHSEYVNAGYARRFENSPFAAGAALVVQGGIGWTYSGLNTRFGTRDDASALFAVVKLAPAVAWQVNDKLSLGAALGVNYFGGTQELFPNTTSGPVPGLPTGFNGFRFKGASGIGLNSKWGLQYKLIDDVTIGMTYGTKTSIPMKNGNMRLNLSNFGLGVVRYDNAKLEGFRLPEELAVGVSFRPVPSVLLSLQEKWYDWSKALNTLKLTASSPRGAVPAPFQKVVISSVADFQDQHVFEIGFAWDMSPETTLMGGFNYARQPVPTQNISPIFAPIPTRHVMAGISRKFDKEWQVTGGLEWFTPITVTYTNPVFGVDAREHNNTSVFHFSASRRW